MNVEEKKAENITKITTQLYFISKFNCNKENLAFIFYMLKSHVQVARNVVSKSTKTSQICPTSEVLFKDGSNIKQLVLSETLLPLE